MALKSYDTLAVINYRIQLKIDELKRRIKILSD